MIKNVTDIPENVVDVLLVVGILNSKRGAKIVSFCKVVVLLSIIYPFYIVMHFLRTTVLFIYLFLSSSAKRP